MKFLRLKKFARGTRMRSLLTMGVVDLNIEIDWTNDEYFICYFDLAQLHTCMDVVFSSSKLSQFDSTHYLNAIFMNCRTYYNNVESCRFKHWNILNKWWMFCLLHWSFSITHVYGCCGFFLLSSVNLIGNLNRIIWIEDQTII